MSTLGSDADSQLAGASLGNKILRAQQGFKSPRISPPSIEDLIGEGTFLDVKVVDVYAEADLKHLARIGLAETLKWNFVLAVSFYAAK